MEKDASLLDAARSITGEKHPARRRALLAEAVVEHGTALIQAISSLAPQEGPAAGSTDLSEIASEASELWSGWLSGTRISRRPDEGERRVQELRRLAGEEPDDPVLGRLAADAVMRLPAGSPLRDEAFARRTLLGLLQRAQDQRGDENDLLEALFYLLHHRLTPGPEAWTLIEEGLEAVAHGGAAGPPIGDFVEAAHGYCIVSATQDWLRRGDGYFLWLARARELLAVAEGLGEVIGPRLARLRALQFDTADDAAEAAAAYAAIPSGEDLEQVRRQMQVVAEATLRLQIGDYGRVVTLTAALLPITAERYLTAVAEEDVDSTGFVLGRAVSLLVSGLVHLDRYQEAVEIVDVSKSLRLRYRSALAQHPSRPDVLKLERALLGLSRHARAPTPNPPAAEGSGFGVSLRLQLLEQYRRTRPDLGAVVTSCPSVDEIAAVLAKNEGAVILAGCDDLTLVALITQAGDLSVAPLTSSPWEDWSTLFEGDEGWLQVLSGHQIGRDATALPKLLAHADRMLGRPIRKLADQEGISILAVIPHRWLHLVPFWALPSLDEYPVSLFSSARELVATRQRPAGGGVEGHLVAADPTGDLPGSWSEAQSVRRLADDLTVLGPGRAKPATRGEIAARLPGSRLFHFSGHAISDHRRPERSALLVTPTPLLTHDPFPAWVAAAVGWQETPGGERFCDVPSVGVLTEERDLATGRLERRLERGLEPTLVARYRGEALVQLGELWSAEDLATSGVSTGCEVAFLSACEASVAGGGSAYIDEYGGLPAALRLDGVRTVLACLWPVDEGLAAMFVDRFYARLVDGASDPAAVAREVRAWLRRATYPEVRAYVDVMADRVRADSPRAALLLEAFAAGLADRGATPFGDPREWAAFGALGGGIPWVARGGKDEDHAG
jgi:CHAT domain-containing protein